MTTILADHEKAFNSLLDAVSPGEKVDRKKLVGAVPGKLQEATKLSLLAVVIAERGDFSVSAGVKGGTFKILLTDSSISD